ncbi:MAG: adenylate/guanylate cyclase domain-containing protein [Myxococcota bacterium]
MAERRGAEGALRAELAESIDRTLQQQARLNELAIARIRVGTLLAAAGIELWLVSGPTSLGSAAPYLATWTAAYLLAAVGVWAALRRGAWANWVGLVLPLLDATYMLGRMAAIFLISGWQRAAAVQELTTVMGMAALLVATGAFRLDTRAVALTTTLGVAMYLGFAAWIGLRPFHASVHLALLLAIGGTSVALTRLVRRAVQSEVTRLTLRRLLPAPVIDAADSDPMALLTEPRSVEVTVVVTDLRAFTTWAEHRTPLEVLDLLNSVQGALSDIVLDEGGTVDKFMGDGMLAVFGAPQPLADHADRAVSAVRRMLKAAERFAPPLALGVGVHTGEVVVGCVGSGVRMEFTVLGDTVNTASRLEGATKQAGVPVLISDATRARCTVALQPVGTVPIRGRDAGIDAFTVA